MISLGLNTVNNYHNRYSKSDNVQKSAYNDNSPLKAVKADPIYLRARILPFRGNEGPSRQTLRYIEDVRSEEHSRSRRLNRLSRLDLDKIQDIAKGIDIFKGWSIYDIDYVSRYMDSILLQRGCPHQCIHCAPNAEDKITTMSWKNFEAIANGMGELKDRLGFSPFSFVSEKSDERIIYSFSDSDPMFFRSPEEISNENGNKKIIHHDIHDAAKLFYEKTGTKFVITTAGWPPNNKFAQRAAEKIVQNDDCIYEVTISLHLFERTVEKARGFEEKARILREEAQELEEDGKNTEAQEKLDAAGKHETTANFLRKRYYDMMANTIFTFVPLIKKGKVDILFMPFPEETATNDFYKKDVEDSNKKLESSLLKEIKSRIKQRMEESSGEPINGLDEIFSINEERFKGSEENRAKIFERKISYIGRAINLDPSGSSSVEQERQKVYSELESTPQSKLYSKLYSKQKRINIDGSVLVNCSPDTKLGEVNFYPVRLTGKKLNLPEKQEINTQREVPEYDWPDESITKKRY